MLTENSALGRDQGGTLSVLSVSSLPPGDQKFTVITPDPLVCLDTRSRTCDCTYVQLLENEIGIIHSLFYSFLFHSFLLVLYSRDLSIWVQIIKPASFTLMCVLLYSVECCHLSAIPLRSSAWAVDVGCWVLVFLCTREDALFTGVPGSS